MKKVIIAVISLVLISFLGVTYSVYGDEEEVIQISTPEGLIDIKDNPYGSYELTDNIDMEGVKWEPFSFYGALDGKGYCILNLEISDVGTDRRITYDGNYKEYDTCFAGLFSCMENAAITDINFYNICVDIDIEDNCFIGSIAGYSENSTITNSTVLGNLSLTVDAPMFGVGGVIGFGNGAVNQVTTNTTLICIDTNVNERDEQFMGGICGAGYVNMDNCDVTIDGYVSDHGYVHNGGLMGMYFFYPKGTSYYGSITSNRVSGKITFFEDNTDRRAYCKPIVGEYLTYEFEYTGNWESFTSDERHEYDKNLLPHMCENPEYDDVITEPLMDTFGYTTHNCKSCGYTYVDDYSIYVDPSKVEPDTEADTTKETTTEATETETETLSEGEDESNETVYKIIIAVVGVMVVITIIMVAVILKTKHK